MGGTFDRLVQQGHDVHVAYHTSGNIAVNDSKVFETTELIRRIIKSLKLSELNNLMSDGKKNINKNHIKWVDNFHQNINKLLTKEIDFQGYKTINKIKGIIRKSEAYQACRYLDLKDESKIHYLDMPFYQTG